jgi:hypothetical protein
MAQALLSVHLLSNPVASFPLGTLAGFRLSLLATLDGAAPSGHDLSFPITDLFFLRALFCYSTLTLKLAGELGATVAVAVDPFGLDSVPSAICAVAAKVCTPAFNVTGPLVPAIPVTAELAPLGAGTENSFTGVPPPVMS